MAHIGVIGVPSNSSGRVDGCAAAPRVLREAGLLDALARFAEVVDLGDVEVPGAGPARDDATGLIDPFGFTAMVKATREAVARAINDGVFPLVLGGDCPLLLGCLAAAGEGPGLLFVDGHEDAYTPAQSTTGEAADTELAFALGIARAPWDAELNRLLPLLPLESLALLGPRDRATLDAEGVESLRGRAAFFDDAELTADVQAVTTGVLAQLPKPWWFHLDLDVLSTEALPAVDYRQPGGLGWDDLMSLSRESLAADPVGWDVTIYNPDLDPDRSSAGRIVAFLADAVRLMV